MSGAAPQFRVRVPRIAEEAVERARLSVVPRTRQQAPRVPFLMLVSVVLLAGVVGLLLFNTNMQQASFAGKALEQRATSLAAREQTLKLELEQLRNPQRIAEQAQSLGMGIPASTGFLHLADGSVSGSAQAVTREHQLGLLGRAAVKPVSIAPRTRFVRAPAVPPSPVPVQAAGSTAGSTAGAPTDPSARTSVRAKARRSAASARR